MNWFKSMNDALTYIEEHIEDDIDYDDVAKIALSSKSHFLRMFSMIAEVTLGEYIRQRRLSLAAKDLVSSNARVIDIAVKYGYDTPEAFTKAFKRLHGIAPSYARKNSSSLKAIPPLSFQITIKGDERMDYQIIKKDSFKMYGLVKGIEKGQNPNEEVPLFWKEKYENGTTQILKAPTGTIYGVLYNYNFDTDEYTYMIGSDADDFKGDARFTSIEIPSSTWAVFDSIGPMPHSIQKVWKRIYSEWFPATKYEHSNGPELEVYLPGDAESDDYKCQIWIPIVEK